MMLAPPVIGGRKMKNLALSLPTFGFVVGTRAALAFGVALLVSERMPPSQRRALGYALLAFGAVTTVPAARSVIAGMTTSNHL
jgi:hypothetical protein